MPAFPSLFIVGAPKCGTTAWYRYLGDHPEVFFPELKEPHYFCEDLPGFRRITDEPSYLDLFEDGAGTAVVGEASVFYLYSAVAADRIAKFNPNAKILIFLREQADFLPSLHHQYLYHFQETIGDFEAAWRLSDKRPPETIPPTCREPKLLDYAAVGRFQEQVERYLAVFPPDQMRVVYFDDWIGDPRSTYRGILEFLGLPDDGRTDFTPVNAAKHVRNKLLARLTQYPPGPMLKVIKALKRVSGRSTLGIAKQIEKLNRGTGYRTSIDPALKDEIRALYAAGNAMLAKRLRETGTALRGSVSSSATDSQTSRPVP